MGSAIEQVVDTKNTPPHVPMIGHLLAEVDDRLRKSTVDLDSAGYALPSSGFYPQHRDLTHPDLCIETFHAVTHPDYINPDKGQGLLDTINGVLLVVYERAKIARVGGAVEETTRNALVDGAWMPFELEMRHVASRAEGQGHWHPYQDILAGNSDVFIVCSVEAGHGNGLAGKAGNVGRLVVRSLIFPNQPDAGDVVIQQAIPVVSPGTRTSEDHFEFAHDFADTGKFARTKEAEWEQIIEKGSQGRSMAASQRLVEEVASLLYGNNPRKVGKDAVSFHEYLQSFKNEKLHAAHVVGAVRTVLRAQVILRQLDEKLKSFHNRQDRQRIEEAKARVFFDLKYVGTRINLLQSYEKIRQNDVISKYPHLADKSERWSRAAILATDDIDAEIIQAAKAALMANRTQRGKKLLEDLISFLDDKDPIKDRENTLVITALGVQNALRVRKTLDPNNPRFHEFKLPSGKSVDLVRSYTFEDSGLPYGVRGGHYPHELVRSLVDSQDRKIFPFGLGFGGVSAGVEIFTPETIDEPEERVSLVVFSGRHAPASIGRAIVGPYYDGPKQCAELMERISKGEVEILSLLAKPKTQTYYLIEEAKAQRTGGNYTGGHLRILEGPLTNGDAFIILENAAKKIQLYRGKVPGERHVQRSLLQRRYPLRGRGRPPRIESHKRLTFNDPGVKAATLLSVILAQGAVFVQDSESERISAKAVPHFIVPKDPKSLTRQEKKAYRRKVTTRRTHIKKGLVDV